MSFEAIKLKDCIGSEIRSDVPSLLTPEIAAEVRRLLVKRGVLVFKTLNLSDDQQVTLAGMLGSLREEGEKGIFKVTLDRKLNSRADYLKGSFLWHIDGTHDDTPVFASLLSGRTLSTIGGQTEFASTYAAYDALPQETKDRIDGLKVVHSFAVSMRRAGVEPTEADLAHWRSIPDKTHNLVWTHRSGRKSLVIGCHASHVVGMDRAEGEAFLRELLDWATQPRFMYRHEWSPGDMLIWDNTGVMHRAEPYPLDSGRVMHRTTLLGEEAFA
ncbi:TauD/TfdA family dioxygenase [Phenylobacterium sp. LjRoot225]|uniref:TauD/TfdA dioxygenase family protein n=1 Tax=Phenylobacterium sp. LjRoot225 TaxID=3342285 RepID=UPI003ECF410D